MKTTALLVFAALLVTAGCAGFAAEVGSTVVIEEVRSEQARFAVREIVTGLVRPWALDFLPGGDMIITLRGGGMLRVGDGTVREITGLPSIPAVGQGGLLDVAVSPDFASTGRIYFTHAFSGSGGVGTAVSRAVLNGTRVTRVERIFEMDGLTGSGRHFGSRLVFLPDGTILFTIGDRGARDRAQDLGDHAGSTLRINPDGSIPDDNPFLDNPDAVPELYTYGNRNAQGMAIQPSTGLVWQHEHGPQGGDELNVIQAGENYGWPEITYGREYGTGAPIGEGRTAPSVPDPMTVWTPSIAPSGMAFYTGSRFPEWEGDIFVGALAGQHLRRVEVSGTRVTGEEVLLQGRLGRIRDVRTGPDGYLYLLTDADSAGLYRLEPAP